MRFVKPLDEALILELAKTHEIFVTIEDNAIAGGAGSAVNELLQSRQCYAPVLNLGLPDEFLEQGSREELLALCGLDSDGITGAIERYAANLDALKPASSRVTVVKRGL
jgi:1-deoxy-D-xylulose-5-phosphate synthase